MSKVHPLIRGAENTNKQHLKNGKNNIFKMEKELTVCQMQGFCIGCIHKYSNRDKGEDESDAKKVIQYNGYLYELNRIPRRFMDTSVNRAWKKIKIEWDYNG